MIAPSSRSFHSVMVELMYRKTNTATTSTTRKLSSVVRKGTSVASWAQQVCHQPHVCTSLIDYVLLDNNHDNSVSNIVVTSKQIILIDFGNNVYSMIVVDNEDKSRDSGLSVTVKEITDALSVRVCIHSEHDHQDDDKEKQIRYSLPSDDIWQHVTASMNDCRDKSRVELYLSSSVVGLQLSSTTANETIHKVSMVHVTGGRITTIQEECVSMGELLKSINNQNLSKLIHDTEKSKTSLGTQRLTTAAVEDQSTDTVSVPTRMNVSNPTPSNSKQDDASPDRRTSTLLFLYSSPVQAPSRQLLTQPSQNNDPASISSSVHNPYSDYDDDDSNDSNAIIKRVQTKYLQQLVHSPQVSLQTQGPSTLLFYQQTSGDMSSSWSEDDHNHNDLVRPTLPTTPEQVVLQSSVVTHSHPHDEAPTDLKRLYVASKKDKKHKKQKKKRNKEQKKDKL